MPEGAQDGHPKWIFVHHRYYRLYRIPDPVRTGPRQGNRRQERGTPTPGVEQGRFGGLAGKNM